MAIDISTKSKYQVLADLLRSEIKSKSFEPGNPFYSESQLCEKYSVSHITVRQALGVLTAEGLLSRIQGKGTFVQEPPVKLKRFKFLIRDAALNKHSFFFDVIKGCEAASNAEAELSIHTYRHEDASFAAAVEACTSDGFFVMGAPVGEEVLALEKTTIPFVLVGAYLVNKKFHAVYADLYRSTFQITEYLIKKGHKKIALLGGFHSRSPLEKDFLRGYQDALNAYNIPFRNKWCSESEWTQEEGWRLARELLKLKDIPTAILAGDDTIAAGVIRVLRENKIQVPQEMAVVGFNDLDIATIVEPRLTTMRVPKFKMGRVAYGMLSKLVKGEKVTQKRVALETELIVRESS